jgi:hypothetical protein
MKNFLIIAGIFFAVMWGVDTFWFGGQYYDAFIRMMSDIARFVR